jgi:hypothetical protein
MSSVIFELMPDEIAIRRMEHAKSELMFSAKPRLNPEGQCLLAVTGESDLQQLWQVSQKALDGLFFVFD